MIPGLEFLPEAKRPKFLKHLRRCYTDYRYFCRFWFDWDPHDVQVRWSDENIQLGLLCCGTGLGKTYGDASFLLWQMWKHPKHLYAIFAPVQKQANLVFEAMGFLMLRQGGAFGLFVKRVVEAPHPKIELWNGASTVALNTAHNAERARGFEFNGGIWDEAAFDKEETMQVLRTRVRRSPGWLRLSTTPKGKNWLYSLSQEIQTEQRKDEAQGKAPADVFLTGTSWDNPYYDRLILERHKARMPSRMYRQEILGEFVETEGATFRYEDLQRVFDATWNPEKEPRRTGLYVNGWDLGRKTTWTVDTCLAFDQQDGVEGETRGIEQREFYMERWPTIFSEIEEREAYWSGNGAHCSTILDATGVGDVVSQSVGVDATAFLFTAKSRGELILRLQHKVETPGALRLPASWSRLYTQMQLHTAKEDAEGETWDHLDSLALAVWRADELAFRGLAYVALG